MENLNLNTNSSNPEIIEMNLFQKIIGVFVRPVETMKAVAAKPNIWIPMVIMAIAPMLMMLIQKDLYESFMKHVTEMAISSSPNAAQLTQEQIQASVSMNSKIAVFLTPVSVIFSWLLGSLVLFGIMKIFKGEGKYTQYLSVTGFASMIMSFYYLLSFGLSYVTGEVYLNASLALLVPDMKGEIVYGILRGIDFFNIWHYCVIAIGVSVLSKVSKAKVYSVAALMYLVAVMIGINSFRFM